MSGVEICYMPISELAPLLKKGQISPVEVTAAYLARINEINPILNAYTDILEKDAKDAAAKAERDILAGQYIGPLHGIPLAVKDLFHIQGVLTTAGSKVMAVVPAMDATVVRLLKESGAIILGKTHMIEFAYAGRTTNDTLGPCHNPWNLERFPGSSSSGSASATAAGLCAGSLGSDTGGSIRLPAAMSSLVGLKPTYGRVSRYGGVTLCPTLDHFGPMTRTVADCAFMLQAIAGHDSSDPTSSREEIDDYITGIDAGVTGMTIGVLGGYWSSGVDSDVLPFVNNTPVVLERLGADIREVSLEAHASNEVLSAIMLTEATSTLGHWVKTHPHDLDSSVKARLEAGHLILAADYMKALQARQQLLIECRKAFEGVDVLIAPANVQVAPKIGDDAAYWKGQTKEFIGSQVRFTGPFNLTGLPAISVPCGFTDSGLPVGFQIIGRPFDEATVLQVAHAFEQATEWHKHRPPIK